MKTIQSMPDIWDNQAFLTTKEEVLGELANWAVRLSPDTFPENLEKGLLEFWAQFDNAEHFVVNCNDLEYKIQAAFERCPTIMSWNELKKDNVQHYDFIGLDALARNIAHSITLQAKYVKLHQ